MFNSFIINAEQSIIVGQTAKADFSVEWGSGFTVLDQTDITGPDTFLGLSSNGDQIVLWDADPNAGPANLIASVTFGVLTLGVSLEWALDGQSLGLSVAGEDGAYTSASGNVGSPGIAGITAVSEPGSFAILGLGAIGMMVLRRRLYAKTVR